MEKRLVVAGLCTMHYRFQAFHLSFGYWPCLALVAGTRMEILETPSSETGYDRSDTLMASTLLPVSFFY